MFAEGGQVGVARDDDLGAGGEGCRQDDIVVGIIFDDRLQFRASEDVAVVLQLFVGQTPDEQTALVGLPDSSGRRPEDEKPADKDVGVDDSPDHLPRLRPVFFSRRGASALFDRRARRTAVTS